MVNSYLAVLEGDDKKINGQIFNVGFKNQSVNELAQEVKEVIGDDVKIIIQNLMIIDLIMLAQKNQKSIGF